MGVLCCTAGRPRRLAGAEGSYAGPVVWLTLRCSPMELEDLGGDLAGGGGVW